MPFEFMTEPTTKKRRFSFFGSSREEPKAPGRVFVTDSMDFSKFEESVRGFDSHELLYGEREDIQVDWAFLCFKNKDILEETSLFLGQDLKPGSSYDFWTYRPGDVVYLVTMNEEFDWVTKVTEYNLRIWVINIK
ncbi:hypothetical protein IJH72_01925 [Candidatus Saccharibacteria bacterium]|nr:hypothetical protein [Candidatus Saccharibacteria bacterium]